MKRCWWRIVFLVAVLVVPISVGANTQSDDPPGTETPGTETPGTETPGTETPGTVTTCTTCGSCYIYCGRLHDVQSKTSSECCSQMETYICPEDNYPTAITWERVEDSPLLCEPVPVQ